MSNLKRRVLRRLVRSRDSKGLIGRVGTWYAEQKGWLLSCGLRIIITDPNEYIQSQILGWGVYEPEISRVITALLRPGDVFLDVGGNIGNHTLVAASCGATVHSFEPVSRLAAALRRNVALNSLERVVTVYEMAVGERGGVATLNIAKRSDDGSHSIIPGVDAEAVERVEVKVQSLDEHVKAQPSLGPTLVKIDVEGYEARVLDGALRLLSRSPQPAIIIETGDRLADCIGESARSVLERLFSVGYAVYQIPSDGGLIQESLAGVCGELRNYLCVHPRASTLCGRIQALIPSGPAYSS